MIRVITLSALLVAPWLTSCSARPPYPPPEAQLAVAAASLLVAPWLASLYAPTPYFPPPGTQSAAVGIAVKLSGSFDWRDRQFPSVFFIKLDEEQDPDKPRQLIASTHYSLHGLSQAYLFNFNAQPGRYAAVAYYWDARERLDEESVNKVLLFPRNLIKGSEITVGPGAIGFMGTFDVSVVRASDRAADLYRLDDVQRHIFTLLNSLPGTVHFKDHVAPFPGWVQYWYKPRVWEGKHDRPDEEEFLLNTGHDLQANRESDWFAVVQKRLEALKARQ